MQEELPSPNQTDPQPAPQQSEPAPLPPIFTDPPATPPVTPAAPAGDAPRRKGRKAKFIIAIVLLLIVAGVAIGYMKWSPSKPAASTKKDIPYLTYGMDGTGDMTPTYPVNAENVSDPILINAQLFEGLVRYQDEIKVAPALATSWSNPNNTTWIFNLRHGVKFHSGRTMTAADVKYSLDYAVTNQAEDQNSTVLAEASNIDQVSVVNPYQVKITTNGPDAVLLNQLAYLYIVDSKAKLGDPNAGTGPYSIKPGSIKPNATSVDLVASNDYWGGHVYTRAIHFEEVPTIDQLTTDTANGKFDIGGDALSSQQLATIKAKAAYYRPIAIPELGLQYIELNLEKAGSPLQSVAARQAVTYALNIPAILKAGGINGTQASQVIPPTLPGYDPSIKNTPYDPAKAKKLLATAPNATAPLTLVYSSSEKDEVTEAAKQLNAVGFNVQATGVSDFSTFLNEVVAGQGDMFYLGYDTNTLDGLDMINNTVAGTSNYTSTQLTNLINQAGSTIDPASRIAVLQKLEQLIASDIPTVPLYTATYTYALTKPYVINTNIAGVLTGTYFYQVYQQ